MHEVTALPAGGPLGGAEGPAPEPPRVSLLVAVLDEAAALPACLQSIFAQDYPAAQLEVFVVDGGSQDGSRQLAANLLAGHPQAVLMDNPGRIQAVAWNLALQRAQGELVGLVSAHSELAPDYVTRCVHHFATTGAWWVGGPQRAVGDTPAGQAVAMAMGSRLGAGNARYRYVTTDVPQVVDVSWPGMFRRACLARTGGFDEELVKHQDDELLYRFRQAGGTVLLARDVRTLYRPRPSLRAAFGQYFGYGYWRVRAAQKHGRVVAWRHAVPGAFCAGLVASAALGLWVRSAVLAAAAPLAYVAGIVGVSATLAWRQPQVLLRLPLAFACLHVGYGLGTWAGLWRFVVRQGRGRGPRATP